MTKQEKIQVVSEISAKLAEKPNVYITDAGGMTVQQVNKLRALCFKAGVEMRVVKNTLLKKAMEGSGKDYSEIYPVLKLQSAVMFVNENVKSPAQVIKEFRGKAGEKPVLKGAYVNGASFIGNDQLATLNSLKSKEEMIGEIISALMAPVQNVISALQSGGATIHGVLKTLEEKNA